VCVLVIGAGGQALQDCIFGVEVGLVRGVAVAHGAVPDRTHESRVRAAAATRQSRVIHIAVQNGRRGWIYALEIGDNLLAHVVGIRVPIP
jgi:hypothetical protein